MVSLVQEDRAVKIAQERGISYPEALRWVYAHPEPPILNRADPEYYVERRRRMVRFAYRKRQREITPLL